MLTEEERRELLHAVEAWADAAPDEPVLGFVGGEGFCSPRELVRAVQSFSDTGEAFLELLEHGVRREGLERVVGRFYRAAEPHNDSPSS
jgi:hypothetical protein